MPYPEVSQKLVNGLKTLCLKRFTQKSMQEQAKDQERERLMKMGQTNMKKIETLQNEVQLENQMNMFKVL